jgi:prophage antirepressor-like protein
MQYALKVFETEDHFDFRTLDRDGEPWFVLADACRALELKNVPGAASRLDPDERMTIALTDSHSGERGGARSMIIVNESGLYSLILRSDKPSAKKFKKWVTSVVLPQIRKTGGYQGRVPAFIARFNANADRVDVGYFSVINELVIRLWGRLELLGYKMSDHGPDGKELRPDVSVGKGFAKWLNDLHPEAANDHSPYVHWTPQADVLARQYRIGLLPLYIEYVDTVWIPECAEDYFKRRDPGALPYLPKLLPDPSKPRPGMMRQRTLAYPKRKKAS